MEAKEAKDQLHVESPKGAKSAFWDHFGFEIDENSKRVDDKIVHCRICQRKIGFSGNTTVHPRLSESRLSEPSIIRMMPNVLCACANRLINSY